MKISLMDAGRLLGKSARQVRYLIKSGRLRAVKDSGRWVIEDADLPRSEEQRRASERKAQELAATVEAALGPHLRKGRPYSVRDVRAFESAVASCRAVTALLGEHGATTALTGSVVWVAQGCHRFHGREKAAAFREARERAAEAIALLHLQGGAAALGIVDGVEQDYLPILAGLLRRHERRGMA